MKTDLQATVQGFYLLSDPTRLAILHLLAKGPLNVTAIAKTLGIERTFTGGPLSLLRVGRLVEAERRGKTVVYSVDKAAMKALALDLKSLMPK